MSPLSSQALLLVDGYNVIGAWSSLKQTRDQYGLELARLELVETLINYTAYKGYKTQIVFDAHYQNTPSYQEDHTPYVSAYYTAFAQTADTYIEKTCASLRQQLALEISRLIVVTSDQAQRNTVVGYGAEWMSTQLLASEVDLVARQARRKHRPQKQNRGRFLFNSLDPKAQERLQQWRQGS